MPTLYSSHAIRATGQELLTSQLDEFTTAAPILLACTKGIDDKSRQLKKILKAKDKSKSDITRARNEADISRRKYRMSRVQNKYQKERGADHTYKVVGRVPYKLLYASVQ